MMKRILRYNQAAVQAAYENACDCHYFGMSPSEWQDCSIPEDLRKEVWAVAWYDMGDGCEENGAKSISAIMAEVYGERSVA